MKVYVITVEDIFDYDSTHREPIIKLTKKEAVSTMRALAKEAKPDFKNIPDMVYESGPTSIQMYPEGYYGENHFSVTIDCLDVPGIVKVK